MSVPPARSSRVRRWSRRSARTCGTCRHGRSGCARGAGASTAAASSPANSRRSRSSRSSPSGGRARRNPRPPPGRGAPTGRRRLPVRTAELQKVPPLAGLSARTAPGALGGRADPRARLAGGARGRAPRGAAAALVPVAGGRRSLPTPRRRGRTAAAPLPARRRPPLAPDRAEAVRQEAARILRGTARYSGSSGFRATAWRKAASASEIRRARRVRSPRFRDTSRLHVGAAAFRAVEQEGDVGCPPLG